MEGSYVLRFSADEGRYNFEDTITFKSDGSFVVAIKKNHWNETSNLSGAGTYATQGNKVTLNFTSKEFANPEGCELTFTTTDKDLLEWPGVGHGDGDVMRRV